MKKGFTLIELIVVIAILAILAAIAVPNFIGLINTASEATEKAAAAQYATAINIANALETDENERITTNPTDTTGVEAVNSLLEEHGVEVSTDMDNDELLEKVFSRLTVVNGNFLLDQD